MCIQFSNPEMLASASRASIILLAKSLLQMNEDEHLFHTLSVILGPLVHLAYLYRFFVTLALSAKIGINIIYTYCIRRFRCLYNFVSRYIYNCKK